ncbi:hypothetical protein PIIN_09110 [Serendipita indica DSM 11827]|uniref:Uncharacterized protein n=1 Tax=Serendipita indica (strain DSM 11827) TaxID=1109443 RepID=G4TUY3_SERID|nr:hypothetical protein PIIN_09110 [Serendipita indica DSM 11827]
MPGSSLVLAKICVFGADSFSTGPMEHCSNGIRRILPMYGRPCLIFNDESIASTASIDSILDNIGKNHACRAQRQTS